MRVEWKPWLSTALLLSGALLACKGLQRSDLAEGGRETEFNTQSSLAVRVPLLRCDDIVTTKDSRVAVMVVEDDAHSKAAPREVVEALQPSNAEQLQYVQVNIIKWEKQRGASALIDGWYKKSTYVGIVSDVMFAESKGRLSLDGIGNERVGRVESFLARLNIADRSRELNLKNYSLRCARPAKVIARMEGGEGKPLSLVMTLQLNKFESFAC